MARVTPDAIDAPFEKPEENLRGCQHEGCAEAGLHRAPRSRDRLNEYYWFCKEHVRLYNLAWNYFVGMDEDQIESQRRKDTVWQRPSWPFGSQAQRLEAEARAQLERDFGLGSDGPRGSNGASKPRHADEQALALLNLSRPVTFPEIKTRYKQLVKQLHPDANGSDAEAEERLKLVNQAYATLKQSFVQ